ncbi:MAG: NAD-dependent epimerase/dehydratase family protein [Desulfuromonadaceae bacterium]
MTVNLQDKQCVESFKGKSILITGGAGYLASNLVSLLGQTECRIIRMDRPDAGWEKVSGAAQVTDVTCDICDPSVWNVLEGIDFIFHLAAQTSTYVANAAPVDDQAINVMPMLNLLEACRLLGTCPTVCFASTVTIAGIPDRLPVDETHPNHPLTVYDLHKFMAEQYLCWYAEQGFVNGVALRLANVYGPGPRSSRSDRGILNQMVRRALEGKELTVYGTGEYVRDYVYVEDVARAFMSAALHGRMLSGRYFVIGSGAGYSIAEAMRMIADHATTKTGLPVDVEHIDPPDALSPIEQRHFVADSRRFSEATGWKARYSLAEGIDHTMEAFS